MLLEYAVTAEIRVMIDARIEAVLRRLVEKVERNRSPYKVLMNEHLKEIVNELTAGVLDW